MSVGIECPGTSDDDVSHGLPIVNEAAHDDMEELEEEPSVDPIDDIIDYLVRCTREAFPCPRVGEDELSNSHKTTIAKDLYARSMSGFLARFGKHLVSNHLQFFEDTVDASEREEVMKQIKQLKIYLSPEDRQKRSKNRRYRTLEQLRDETDYFSEKEMMYRNPLLYDQLIGQFLTTEEIAVRDNVDSEQLTFVTMILDTVDRNQMRQTMNEQELSEKMETTGIEEKKEKKKVKAPRVTSHWGEFEGTSEQSTNRRSHWGDFEKPDTTPKFEPQVQKQNMISAPERDLLRREFLHEMYNSFLDGRDDNFDYTAVDDNEQLDDLQVVDRDEEEKYFDSEPVESQHLEQSLTLTQEYAKKESSDAEDELDVFMDRLNKKRQMNY